MKTWCALGGLALCAAGFSQSPYRLSGGSGALLVDRSAGTILSLEEPTSGVRLSAPPRTAESFRLVLMRPDKSEATVLGRDQKLTHATQFADGLELRWDGPLRDTTGTGYDVAATMRIKALANGFEFRLHVDNRSPLKVKEAWYPMLGGLQGFAKDAKLWVPTATPWEGALGNAEFGYPGQMCMSFLCLTGDRGRRSLYLSSEDQVARYKTYRFIQQPVGGEQTTTACVRHYPFTPPGRSFDGSPVTVQFLKGDRRACGEEYRRWFARAFGICKPERCWIRNQSFFVMTMFMLPEGTINYRFKDIPRWAKAAKSCGIDAVQISGWQMGGHDNGYPDYTPDPRLGTWKDLENGIRACHKLGLKVYFFANYGQAMVETDWYKRELHRYREQRADGGPTWLAGWGMGTVWARMDHPKLMTWIDLSFPQFRRIIVDKFAKLAQIGADGVHVDKMFPTAIEYNPDVPLSPDTASWQGSIILTKEVMAACRRYRPDWAMSFECNWDRLLQFTDATWWVGNQRITREVFPEHVETLGLYNAWDFLGVNNAVRDGYAVMVAPMFFCRTTDWPPFRELGRYIKEVKAIQDSLRETAFLGAVTGHAGVDLVGAGGASLDYTVHRNVKTGRRVCIVTNASMEAGQATVRGFGGRHGGHARVFAPFTAPKTVRLPARITVPGERIVFVEELGGAR